MSRAARESHDEGAFVAQRLATLGRVPCFVGGREAARSLSELYQRALATGRLVHVHGADWQLVYFRDPEVWYGGEATIGFADRGAHAPRALTELRAALRAHADALDATTFLEVAADDDALREAVTDETGLEVDAVLQVGRTDVALAALHDAVMRPGGPGGPRGAAVAIREARPGDVDAIVALARDAFTAEPEYCWFGAFPHHLALVHRAIESAIRTGAGVHLVLEGEGREVLGHVGADIDQHAYWGRSAGLDIVLAPALRGRGLLKVLYRETLARLVHVHRVATLRGGTSQPGVLALGLRMGRAWGALYMRRNVAFPFAHFARFAPPAAATSHRRQS